MGKEQYVIYVGSNGFPVGMAQVQRQLFIAKALSEGGSSVMVCSRKGVHNRDSSSEEIKSKGCFQGIDYLFCSGTAYYNGNFIVRNLLKIIGVLNEFLFLLGKKINGKLDHLLVNTISLAGLKYYYRLSRLLNVKLIYDYVEQVGELSVSKGQDLRFDAEFTNYCDRVIYISDLLYKNVEMVAPDMPTLKIPPLTDFDVFGKKEPLPEKGAPYFLYCGSASYFEVVKFIIDAFDLISSSLFELVLVVSGSDSDKKAVHERIAISPKKDMITMVSGLSLKDLVARYNAASALLIPLRDSKLDKARFPHKISEYAATGNPIITSPVGEVNRYFKKDENALIASNLTVEAFAKEMEFVVESPQRAADIGERGLELGRKLFDHRSNINSLKDFFGS